MRRPASRKLRRRVRPPRRTPQRVTVADGLRAIFADLRPQAAR